MLDSFVDSLISFREETSQQIQPLLQIKSLKALGKAATVLP